ncbi:MAG: choice-of-anchor Q domain-containing protein [Chloroflexota bacterium]
MKTRLSLAIALLVLVIGVAGRTAAHVPSATFTVNSIIDAVDAFPGNGICATATGECTLRAAVQETNSLTGADTIIVPAGTYSLTVPGAGENAAATGDLDILDDLTLSGDGAATTIVDGNSAVTSDRVFDVLEKTVSLSGLTVQGGRGRPRGGGIKNEGDLTLTGMTVAFNSAARGGGIYNLPNLDLTILSSEIHDNTAISGDSGGDGGGIYASGTLIIEDSTISRNVARRGGGIFKYSGSMRLQNSFVTDNVVEGQRATGGGAEILGSTFVIENSQITGNVARGSAIDVGGGGLYLDDSGVISGSTISSNRVEGLANSLGGGGIYAPFTPVVTIINSTISGNEALGQKGGGIATSGDIQFYNSTVTANVAGEGQGGGLYIPFASSSILHNTIVAGNDTGGDCVGTAISAGYNILGDETGCAFTPAAGDQVGTAGNPIDPLLGPLQDNGGPTATHALLDGSPAIEMGNPAGCTDDQGNLLTSDQRGYTRPVDGDGNGNIVCDIGSFEVQLPAVSFCSTPNLPIPDNNAAGVNDDLILTDTGSITALNVSLVATHTWVGDLVFTLEHVDTGTQVTFINRPGWPPPPSCNGDDIDAILDDEAAGPVEDACTPTPPAISGSLIPNSPLSAFDGEDLSGTWRLTAADVVANDVGTLVEWCVVMTGE